MMPWTSEKGHGGTTHLGKIAASGTGGLGLLDMAIFIPDRFHTSPGIDLILYYHGMTTAYGAKTLQQYLAYKHNSPMRDAVGKHGRFALVIPWLGMSPNASKFYKGFTGSDYSFEIFLRVLINQIRELAGLSRNTDDPVQDVRSLVLGAHSAGGEALAETIALHGKFAGKTVSAWCLDCFYGNHNKSWAAWKKAKPERSICCYYTDPKVGDTTAPNSRALKTLLKGQDKVTIEESAVGHPKIPGHYFPILLQASA